MDSNQDYSLLLAMNLSPTEEDTSDIRAYSSAMHNSHIIAFSCMTRIKLPLK